MKAKKPAKSPKEQAEKQLSKAKAYKIVFGSKEGKVVLDDLFRNHRMMDSVFDKDTHKMAMNEGERNVVLRILAIIGMDLEAFRERIKELDENA